MRYVEVDEFGGPEQLKIKEKPTPEPGPGQVRVAMKSIGMNHAELMSRDGGYKAATGDPPFTPGLEGGGVVEAVGQGVDESRLGQRVVLSPQWTRPTAPGLPDHEWGSYRTHMVLDQSHALAAPGAGPDALPDDQLGAIWLPFLTAWGCLVWKDPVQQGDIVALPAASSSVALAASQVVKERGGVTVGMTSSPEKADRIQQLASAKYDHLIVTHEDDGTLKKWHREIRQITDGAGVNIFFDPVAAGAYLDSEIRSIAKGGRIWVYGLLGEPGPVDVTRLIIRRAAILGWSLTEILDAGEDQWRPACDAILQRFADGRFVQDIGGRFKFDDVQQAHAEMEKGDHLGKLVLLPDAG